MITPDEIKVVDSGSGYTIGEITGSHKYLTYLREGTIVTLFDGVDTALDFIGKLKAKGDRSSARRGRDGFNSFNSFEEAMDIFRNKPEEIVKYDPSELRIKDNSEAGSQVEYDVTGDYIDMGRYMEGIPEVMGTMHSGNARNRRVNIIININQHYGIEHEVIKHRSERILRLTDALEAGGVRTMLTAIESSQCNHSEFIIKQHDEPLTISDLAIVTHPEFLRRAMFRIIEQSKTYSDGYGQALSFGRCLVPEIIEGDNNNELDILIDSNQEYTEDIDRSFDQLERLLVWEMSKPIPEVSSVKIDRNGIFFNPNGARGENEIRQEGQEVING
jgi:hypothetical protein